MASPPEGYEFTIRTPGTPNRWRQYDEELNAVWRKLTSAVCERSDEANIRRPQGEGEEGEDKDDAVCDIILEVRLLQGAAVGNPSNPGRGDLEVLAATMLLQTYLVHT